MREPQAASGSVSAPEAAGSSHKRPRGDEPKYKRYPNTELELLSSRIRQGSDDETDAIAREVALWLAPLGLELTCIHIWSESNDWADDLSRVVEGVSIPPGFLDIPRCEQLPRDWKML